jgi:GNAT superfamily N-acetyltransferase
MQVLIGEWTHEHGRWAELERAVGVMGQTDWVTPVWDWHLSSHVLVASDPDRVCGFLRFVTQVIGSEEDHAPVSFDGRELVEAKVLGFGVLPQFRRKRIGVRLQEQLIARARELGCFQIRSYSSGENIENHMLKLSMGFAVHPVVRGGDLGGVYFLKCLKEHGA